MKNGWAKTAEFWYGESGTEPLIRVMVEAKDADLMQEAVSAIAEELERYTKR